MLTRRGWFLAGGSGVLTLAGRLFGVTELFGLAAGAVALVAGALIYVRFARVDLHATRTVHPTRVHCGASSRVDLAVRNDAPRRSPLLDARDPFDSGRRWARFRVAPLPPGAHARAAYRLPTDRRGVFELGPLTLVVSDPFGIASASFAAAPATKLTVFPHVDVVEPLPHTLGHDPHAGADHATALAASGEDFYALRPYQVGDDLRRVHWPSTAKLGDLMIRQEEMPWQGRATVVLDIRAAVHTSESLEEAVSAAASIITACWKRRSLLRLVDTSGADSGFGAGHTHADAVLEHLARATTEAGGSLAMVARQLRRESNGGALAVVTTARAATSDLEAAARLRGRYGAVYAVVIGAADSPRGDAFGHRPGIAVVRVPAGKSFAAGWNRAMATARPGRAR